MVQRALFWTDPLWPAGHLPLKGGETHWLRYRPTVSRNQLERSCQLLSPLEGEMAGRPEGVAKDFAHPTIDPAETATC